MPVRESEAIVLRSYSLGESDRLVSFLSRAHGRMRGVAPGARRLKSRFGGTLEPLTYVRIWFFERETRDLVRISQTELIESFLDLQSDYFAGVTLGMISEISETTLGEREVAETNFRLALATARAIKAGVAPGSALAYFGLWTVKLGGWLPRLGQCARCGANLTSGAYVSIDGLLFCATCRLAGQRRISQAALELAHRMQVEKLEQFMKDTSSPEALTELRDYMLDTIEHHIEKRLLTRSLLNGIKEKLS